jgi:hypothetical protein
MKILYGVIVGPAATEVNTPFEKFTSLINV